MRVKWSHRWSRAAARKSIAVTARAYGLFTGPALPTQRSAPRGKPPLRSAEKLANQVRLVEPRVRPWVPNLVRCLNQEVVSESRRQSAPTRAAVRNSRTRFKDRTWFGSVEPRWHPRDAPRRPSVEPGSRVSNPGSAFRDHFQVREFPPRRRLCEELELVRLRRIRFGS